MWDLEGQKLVIAGRWSNCGFRRVQWSFWPPGRLLQDWFLNVVRSCLQFSLPVAKHFIIMSIKFLALVERYAKIEDTEYLWEINRSPAFVTYHYLPPVVLYVGCLMFGKNNVCCGFVVYGLHYVEKGSFYSYLLESFYRKWILNFVKSFLWIYWDGCAML